MDREVSEIYQDEYLPGTVYPHIKRAANGADAAIARQDLRLLNVGKFEFIANAPAMASTIVRPYFRSFRPALWVAGTICAFDKLACRHRASREARNYMAATI